MIEDKIKGITIKEGKVVSLDFSFGERSQDYTAKFHEDKIEIPGAVEYFLDNKKTIWKLRHVCGMQGFGMDIDDECHSCTYQGESDDISIAKFNTWFSPWEIEKFSEVVSNELPLYCSKIEDKLNGK